MPTEPLDLTGQTFGRLTALRLSERRGANGRYYWLCRCACGREKEIETGKLRSGHTRSCGCLQSETASDWAASGALAKSHTTHGLLHRNAVHPLFYTWRGMRARCFDPKSKSYKHYGARGIQVCDRWNDFAAFVEDMGEKPSPEHSIDRIDPDGNYDPDNCRWATPKQQAENTRKRRAPAEQEAPS